VIVTSIVLSQYTRDTDDRETDRQTTYHNNSRTVDTAVKLQRSAINCKNMQSRFHYFHRIFLSNQYIVTQIVNS